MTEEQTSIEFIRWASIAICVFSMSLLLWALKSNRSRHIPRKRTLLFAMGIFPLLTLFASDFALIDSMKDDSFCESCHIMKPFVDGLKDPDNEGLAAAHAQHVRIRENRCYTCHIDYDLFGGINGKIRGLRHLYAYYLDDNEERPELYDPYPNGNCFSCHKGTKSYIEIEDHVENEEDILSDEVSCLDCHGPAHINEEDYEK